MTDYEYGDIQIEDWVDTLYAGIESAAFKDDDECPAYFVARWKARPWITTDDISRKDAVRNLIEMVPEMFEYFDED